MGTLDEVIAAVAKARTPKSRWLMVVFLAQFLEWGRSGQNGAVPVLGPLPLEQTNGQARRFEFEVASVRLNEKWKCASFNASLRSVFTRSPGFFGTRLGATTTHSTPNCASCQ